MLRRNTGVNESLTARGKTGDENAVGVDVPRADGVLHHRRNTLRIASTVVRKRLWTVDVEASAVPWSVGEDDHESPLVGKVGVWRSREIRLG